MTNKKSTEKGDRLSGGADQGEIRLVGVARTIGSTLGTAAAKAEDAAKEIETFTHAVRKSTLATTRKIYKRARKSLRAGAASWKSVPKKRKAPKKRSRKSSGRGK